MRDDEAPTEKQETMTEPLSHNTNTPHDHQPEPPKPAPTPAPAPAPVAEHTCADEPVDTDAMGRPVRTPNGNTICSHGRENHDAPRRPEPIPHVH